MSHISLRNIYKSYHKHQMVIKNLSLEIFDDEFLVFVGPSGCGKTTTLRMIAGLEEITKGDLFIDGIKQNDKDPSSRRLSFVFQNYALLPSLTVYENIEFGLLNLKLTKLEKHLMIENIAKKLSIIEKLGSYPHQLSGGQRQRVALARALVDNQKLVLFDEPLSNLDAVLRSAMRMELIKFRNEFEVTGIYVTHDQIEAMGLSTRIVLMIDGRIIQTGTPNQMFNNPNHLNVASFIGSPETNILKGQITNQTFVYQDLAISLNATSNEILRIKDLNTCYLAIRPQDVIISKTKKNGFIKGTVSFVEQFGSNQLIHVDMNGKDILVTIDNQEVYQGDVYLGFNGQSYLFDEDMHRLRIKVNNSIRFNLTTTSDEVFSVIRECINYGYEIWGLNNLSVPDDLMINQMNDKEKQTFGYQIDEIDGTYQLMSDQNQINKLNTLNEVFNHISFISKKEV